MLSQLVTKAQLFTGPILVVAPAVVTVLQLFTAPQFVTVPLAVRVEANVTGPVNVPPVRGM
jgi:hypothetical protein